MTKPVAEEYIDYSFSPILNWIEFANLSWWKYMYSIVYDIERKIMLKVEDWLQIWKSHTQQNIFLV